MTLTYSGSSHSSTSSMPSAQSRSRSAEPRRGGALRSGSASTTGGQSAPRCNRARGRSPRRCRALVRRRHSVAPAAHRSQSRSRRNGASAPGHALGWQGDPSDAGSHFAFSEQTRSIRGYPSSCPASQPLSSAPAVAAPAAAGNTVGRRWWRASRHPAASRPSTTADARSQPLHGRVAVQGSEHADPEGEVAGPDHAEEEARPARVPVRAHHRAAHKSRRQKRHDADGDPSARQADRQVPGLHRPILRDQAPAARPAAILPRHGGTGPTQTKPLRPAARRGDLGRGPRRRIRRRARRRDRRGRGRSRRSDRRRAVRAGRSDHQHQAGARRGEAALVPHPQQRPADGRCSAGCWA